jgi:hypothetical protein
VPTSLAAPDDRQADTSHETALDTCLARLVNDALLAAD